MPASTQHASGCGESQARKPMRAAVAKIEIGKRLLLQAVPAEPVVQPATQDLRVILVGRAWRREIRAALRLAEVGVEIFKAQGPLLAGRVFDAAADGPTGPRLGAGGEAGFIAGR